MTRNDIPPQQRMPRRLPIVEIDRKNFFRDDRLSEFRNVENPYERITFEDYAERRRLGN